MHALAGKNELVLLNGVVNYLSFDVFSPLHELVVKFVRRETATVNLQLVDLDFVFPFDLKEEEDKILLETFVGQRHGVKQAALV